MSLLSTITTSVPALSRFPLSWLNITNTHALSSTKNNCFQTNANPSQTRNQLHTTLNIDSSASLLSSSSVSFVNPRNLPFVTTQNNTELFVALNVSVKNFVGLDHQYTPVEYLQQN